MNQLAASLERHGFDPIAVLGGNGFSVEVGGFHIVFYFDDDGERLLEILRRPPRCLFQPLP